MAELKTGLKGEIVEVVESEPPASFTGAGAAEFPEGRSIKLKITNVLSIVVPEEEVGRTWYEGRYERGV